MKLFISYGHDDKTLCKEIYEYLVDIHETWYDKRLIGGQDWLAEINDRLNWCDAFVYLLSHASVRSEWCETECKIALELGKQVIPVVIQGRTEVPLYLRHLQYVSLTDGMKDIVGLLNAITVAERKLRNPIANSIAISNSSNTSSQGLENSTKIEFDRNREIDSSIVKKFIPEPFEWIQVKGGTVTIKHGRWEEKQKKKGLFSNEKFWEYQFRRDETEYVDSFLIAKHMITNGQFQKFVESPDGYKHDRSWSGSTWHLDNPLPAKSGSEKASEFRVNVNYLEATAFCWWLTMKVNYGSWDKFPVDRKGLRFLFWLPAEDEWQRAMKENAIDKRTSSQLWEWTQTSAEFVDTDVLDQNVSIMVVRGGTRPYGISSPYDDISRSFLYAENRNRETGFRIKCKIQ